MAERMTRKQAADGLLESFIGQPLERHVQCLRRLAGEPGPFYDAPRERWLVCRHLHARNVLRNSRLSNDLSQARSTTKSARLARRLGPSAPSILFLDPPLHTAMRRVLTARLAGGAVRDRRAGIQQRAEMLVRSLARRSEFDLGGEFVQPFAAKTLLELLGFEEPPRDELERLVDDLFAINRLFDLTAGDGAVRHGREASGRLRGRISRELDRRGGLGDDLEAAGVPRDVALASVEFTLRAGIVTSSALHANALVHLSAADAALWPATREELERLVVAASPSLEAGRVPLSDLDVGPARIPARETITLLLPAANLELLASGGAIYGKHVAFGAGRHACVGAELARIQLDALLRALEASGRRLIVHAIEARHDLPTFRGIRAAGAGLVAPA